MNTYKQTFNYRRIYEQFYNTKIGYDNFGRRHDIHHIDGNHDNNDPTNLKEVTVQEHYDIHFAQGDYGACCLIGKRMKLTPAQLSELARLNSKKQLEAGTHVFLDKDRKSGWVRAQIANGRHAFSGEKGQQNAKRNNAKMLANGTHPLSSGVHQKKYQKQLVESGTHHLLGGEIQRRAAYAAVEAGTHPSQVKTHCEHCNRLIGGRYNYNKWHGANCKSINTI